MLVRAPRMVLPTRRDHPATVDGAGACAQPGPQVGINVSGVQVLQNPADGRLRRKILPRLQSQSLQVGGGQVGGVLPYRSQAATAGQHSGHGQRQHRKQVMTHTPPVPGVGDAPENQGQGLARQGGRGGR